MNKLTKLALGACVAGSLSLSSALAVVIDFTGGTVTTVGSSNYYEENGFRVTSVGGLSSFGAYYGGGNNVIHTHWGLGDYGNVTAVEITKIGGGTFDLNYFILTSNTMTGGGAASGTEQTYIRALDGSNAQIGAAVLLPPENWGLGTTTQIFLGSQFDAATTVQFYVTNAVDCFGMDEFYINEAAPGVPDSASTSLLMLLGVAGLVVGLRRRN
ncbi:MAG: hypothetical protein HZC55_07410 [Verrucomicrobia bacterium]|nr:hypothetical protein [Verrucomicrobiota bacterium]